MELQALEKLKAKIAEVVDIVHAVAVLEWDQQTYMPPQGSEARAEQIATLSKIAHEKFTSPEVGKLIQELEPLFREENPESEDYFLFRKVKREYEKDTRISPELVARISRTTALARDKWVVARRESNFSIFAPYLAQIVELMIEKAQALGFDECIYDALVDDFEPGLKTSQIKAMFEELRQGLVPLVRSIKESGIQIRRDFLFRKYDPEKQYQFTLQILEKMGYDFQRGRQDRTAHPFTTAFSIRDVRVTNRFKETLVTSSIFSALHEGGHALYDQGISENYERTFLMRGASHGIHESQSRTWENLVGRSLPFWTFWFPRLREFFPEQLEDVTLEEFYKAINYVEPSPIRVEADEVTYNLHTLLRFELELALLEGRVKVQELPELWNQKMKEYLGYEPQNDAEGVLQDVHWSDGLFGYFPSYTIGNILSVQFFNKAREDIPNLYEQFAQGEYAALREWLRTHIHVHGGKYYPEELMRLVVGEPMNSQPLLTYLREKYSQIYGKI
jgi:carboxypeptidase Taq